MAETALSPAASSREADRCFHEAMALHQGGDGVAALAHLQHCITRHPTFLQSYLALATLLAQQGRFGEAEATVRRGLGVAPSSAPAHHLLAKTLHRQGRMAEAAGAYRAALGQGLRSPELLTEFGGLLTEDGRLDEADALLKEALAANATHTKTLTLLGRVAELRGDLDGAIALHDRALRHHPDNAHAYVNRGTAKRLRGDLAGALRDFDQALTLQPGLPSALASRGLAHLASGNLQPGWNDFRARIRARDGERDLSGDRPWDGTPLDGKRVLVWTEYGIGDEIMAASLLPDLAARAAHCTVVYSHRLASILRRSFAQIEIIVAGEPIADTFDARLPLMDAAAWLRPTFQSFPNTQRYLCADAIQTTALRQRYGAHARRVGISWHSASPGTGPFKSAPLTGWKEILQTPDIFFLSLQYGAAAADAAKVNGECGTDIHVDGTIDPTGDLDIFAAQIDAMDLVITVSNTTAHIAGALGKPTWLLVPEGPGAHWYWFKDRADNPWYPSLRLFRQTRPGDWGAVLATVARELRAWASQ